jgi:hypothetical protein
VMLLFAVDSPQLLPSGPSFSPDSPRLEFVTGVNSCWSKADSGC